MLKAALSPSHDFRLRSLGRLHSLKIDSTTLSDPLCISQGDAADRLTGALFFRTGSLGQPAYASLFAGGSDEMVLIYDELLLDHPVTGRADLNAVPLQSIGEATVLHTPDKPFAFLPLGQTLHVRSMSLADNPIRSQVSYYNGGHGYDDVDARLGALASERLQIDAAGTVRGYNGHLPNSLYDGHQIDVRIKRRVGRNMLIRYLLLANRHAAHVPLFQPIAGYERLRSPLQKEKRSDQALVFRYRDDLTAVLQFTAMDWDRRDEQRSLYHDPHDLRRWRTAVEWAPLVGPFQWRVGLTARRTSDKSPLWGNHLQHYAAAYGAVAVSVAERLQLGARVSAEKSSGFSPRLLPELSLLHTSADSALSLALWANRTVVFPSLQASYNKGFFAWGNPNLRPGIVDRIGFAAERRQRRMFLAAAASLQSHQDRIAISFNGERTVYANVQPYRSALVDLQARFENGNTLFGLRGQAYRPFSAPTEADRPSARLQAFAEYHLVRFKGDLDVRLRIGGELVGGLVAPTPWTAEFSPWKRPMRLQKRPYAQVTLHYHSADIFFAYENLLDEEVQMVYGYPLPRRWMHWGFIWRFVD